MKKIVKYLSLFILCLVLCTVAVSARTYVTCKHKQSTGKGYYDAICSGNYLKCHGYYSSASEKYTTMNYIGVNGNDNTYYVSCDAGNRNGYINQNVGMPYNQKQHNHSFAVYLN